MWLHKRSPYDLLGLKRPTLETRPDDKTIRQAYRKQALLVHPDKLKDDPSARDKFDMVATAYDFLSNPKQREEYDKELLAADEKIRRSAQVSAEKRKLAEALKKREQAAAKARAKPAVSAGTAPSAYAKRREESLRSFEKRSTKRRPESGGLIFDLSDEEDISLVPDTSESPAVSSVTDLSGSDFMTEYISLEEMCLSRLRSLREAHKESEVPSVFR